MSAIERNYSRSPYLRKVRTTYKMLFDISLSEKKVIVICGKKITEGLV